jgi:hypothetical protein
MPVDFMLRKWGTDDIDDPSSANFPGRPRRYSFQLWGTNEKSAGALYLKGKWAKDVEAKEWDETWRESK